MDHKISISQDNKIAVVIGASGLVGGELMEKLLGSSIYSEVVSLGRSKLDIESDKLVQEIIDFDKPKSYMHLVKGDDLFMCLGTTMKKAGSKENFQKVDFTYNYQTALMGYKNGMNQALLVSSVGASLTSLFFYSKVKGQLEYELGKLDFWATHIFRPSIILGERNENRWGEGIAQKIGEGINKLTSDSLKKYQPVEAEIIAKAMYEAAQSLSGGIHIYPSHTLQDLAEKEYNSRKKIR